MGRRSHSRSLFLWVNGIHVGRWTIHARGEMELKYDDAWVRHPRGRPLSLSLPLNFHGQALKGAAVLNYFDNLLPDSEGIRRRVAERFSNGSLDPFDLLRAIGRDCVGAVQILGEHETPTGYDRIDGTPLSDEDVERHLIEAVTPRAFGRAGDPDDDFRISLAGAQEKTAFLFKDGVWHVPHGATPTTHIFKLPLGLVGNRRADLSTSIDNEWLCLRLLRAYGLPAAHAQIGTFGQQRVLIVERFDRQLASSGDWIVRRMQEDFCQVAGCSPLSKYESEGGPGLEAIFGTLQQSVDAAKDMRTLMAAQILFWMLRAPDGHAKNFSIELLAQSRFRLTPLYDVLSAHPVIGNGPHQRSLHELKLAMALLGKNRHYDMQTIQRRHFNSTARRVTYGPDAEPLIQELIERTPHVIAQVQADLPSGFSAEVADKILTGLENAARSMSGMPA